jgi:hypothetical protein
MVEVKAVAAKDPRNTKSPGLNPLQTIEIRPENEVKTLSTSAAGNWKPETGVCSFQFLVSNRPTAPPAQSAASASPCRKLLSP